MASIADLSQQFMNLDALLQTAMARISVLESEVKNSTGGGDFKQSLIKDPKKLYPNVMKEKKDFKKWAADFMRWIRIESDELHNLMEHAAKAKAPIGPERVPAEWASHNHYIYSHLKKLVIDIEPAGIINLVDKDNGLEARRKLNMKYIPKTIVNKSARLRRITNFGIQNQARTLSQVSALIDRYEAKIAK